MFLAEVIASLISSAILRLKAWWAYRRNYSGAERREHSRRTKASDPRGHP